MRAVILSLLGTCGCRLSAAEQNEVETYFTGRWNMLVPYHNLYWTGGSVYTGQWRPAGHSCLVRSLQLCWLCKKRVAISLHHGKQLALALAKAALHRLHTHMIQLCASPQHPLPLRSRTTTWTTQLSQQPQLTRIIHPPQLC